MGSLILFLGLFSYAILGSLADIATCPGFESQTSSSNKSPPLIKYFKSISHKSGLNQTNSTPTDEDPDTIYIYRLAAKAVLNCWAPYPIDLTFKGLLTNINAEVKTSVTSFKSSNGTKTYCYCINVTLGIIDDSIVGNYSCFEASNPKNRVSKYIYVISNPKTVLLRRGLNSTITKVLWRGQKQLTFECAVSDPSVTVNLTKVESNGDIKVFKDLTGEAAYNPKIGFTLNISDKRRNPEGEYICRTPLHESDFVRFNVIQSPKVTYRPRNDLIRRKISHGLNISCSSSDEPVFLSADSSLMSLNPLILNSSRDEYTTTLWVANFTHPADYTVTCSSTSNPQIKRWTISIEATKTVQFTARNNSFTNAAKPFGFLDLNGFNGECKHTREGLILFECNNWVECRMNQCQDEPSKDRYCQSNNRCSSKECMPNGLIQCATGFQKDKDTTISSVIFFHGVTTSTEYSDATALLQSWKHDILKVYVDPESPLLKTPADPKIRLTCLGTNFVVSSGFEWFVIGKNGSSYELTNSMGFSATATELGFNYTISESFGRTKSSLKSDLVIPTKVLLSNPNLLYFQCKAPIWNSTNWVVNSISSKEILVSAQLFEEAQPKKIPTNVKSLSTGKPAAEGFLVALLLTTTAASFAMHLFN